MSGSTGYPWLPGQVLTAADLNHAIQLGSGPAGPPGPEGAPGTEFLAGDGPPTGTPPEGTLYLDASNGDIWQFGTAPVVPPVDTPDPNYYVDFAGGTAWTLAGGTVAISSVISDPSKIVGGTGLVLTAGDSIQSVLGPIASALLASTQTLRVTFALSVDGNSLTMTANDVGDNVELWYISCGYGASSAGGYDEGAGDISVANDGGITGTNTVCVSYAADSFSMSINGSAATNATSTAIVASATQVLLGGYDASGTITSYNECTILKIEGFDLVADADLPPLSSV